MNLILAMPLSDYFSWPGVVLEDCFGLDGVDHGVARGVSTGSQQKSWSGPELLVQCCLCAGERSVSFHPDAFP